MTLEVLGRATILSQILTVELDFLSFEAPALPCFSYQPGEEKYNQNTLNCH